MITCITGLPGHGKSLYTLCRVEALRLKDNREVFYAGIKHLNLPWVNIGDHFGMDTVSPDDHARWDEREAAAARRWMELPSGAVIVIDECQRVFRPRGTGSAVPSWVEKLETHRHSGHDLFLITQDPRIIDSNVRRLVGQHFHVVRRHGTQLAQIYEFAECKQNVEARKGDKSAVKHEFKYPKEAFNWYKSAEVHTHKRNIPMRFWVMLAMPLVVIGCAVVAGRFWYHQLHPDNAVSTAVAKGAVKPAAGTAPASGQPPKEMTTAEYVHEHTPLIAGFPHTAPVYAGITQPAVAPYPAACILSRSKGCNCYTQQGTLMPVVPDATCRTIVAGGMFIDWAQPTNVAGSTQGVANQPGAVAASQPAKDAPVNPTGTDKVIPYSYGLPAAQRSGPV